MLLKMATIHSFYGWVISHCVFVCVCVCVCVFEYIHTTTSVSIHLLIDSLCPYLGYYKSMLLWTLGFMYLLELVSSFFPDVYPGVIYTQQSHGSFSLGGSFILISIRAVPICLPINHIQGGPFLHSSPIFVICKLFDDSQFWEVWGDISLLFYLCFSND